MDRKSDFLNNPINVIELEVRPCLHEKGYKNIASPKAKDMM